MQSRSFALFLSFLCGVTPLPAQQQPTLTGVITDQGTPTEFHVDGYRVVCTPNRTLSQRGSGNVFAGSRECPQHRLGESVLVDGTLTQKTLTLDAERVRVIVPVDVRIVGSALIDKVISRSKNQIAVRADGYALQFTSATRISYESTLVPDPQHITTNQWIEYRGTLHPDGTVAVEAAAVGPNVISDSEDKLRSKQEFDPSAVGEADRQSAAGKFLFGEDRTRIPAYSDPELQARIDRVGSRLIPDFQRALPDGDPSKIAFRFQLVDGSKYAYYALASGIILVSRDVLPMMETDGQLAALLGKAVANVLQKQELRAQPTKHAMAATTIVGDTAGVIVPALPIAALVSNHTVKSKLDRRVSEQNDREALCLMHDAGFDLREAPLALWRLSQKKGHTLQTTPVPDSARYMYGLLSTVWLPRTSPTLPGRGVSLGAAATGQKNQ